VEKNGKEAQKWLLMSAEQENTNAMFNLGLIYLQGQGIPKDESKAFEWFERAAKQNDISSVCNLGYMMLTGKPNGKKDEKEALRLLLKCSPIDKVAAGNLAEMYKFGIGVEKNEKQEKKFVAIASD